MTTTITSAYDDLTASMQVDPEALHHGGTASESYLAFPITRARCASYPTQMEWVPDKERPLVPETMTMLCKHCAGREQCLLWAVATDAQGYWAGSTSSDRQQMMTVGEVSTGLADRIQDEIRHNATVDALHEPEEGSYWWYRRQGCRCAECKEANATQRAGERDKARRKTAVAA